MLSDVTDVDRHLFGVADPADGEVVDARVGQGLQVRDALLGAADEVVLVALLAIGARGILRGIVLGEVGEADENVQRFLERLHV